MFVPTIRHRRVDEPQKDSTTLPNEKSSSEPLCSHHKTTATELITATQDRRNATPSLPEKVVTPLDEGSTKCDTELQPNQQDTVVTLPENKTEAASIVVDPLDTHSIIITLSNGKQYRADRYCPHAGADLSFHGKIAEDEYPPEIGPILMCPMHYWEFALDKQGRAGGGRASIHACSIANDKQLDW